MRAKKNRGHGLGAPAHFNRENAGICFYLQASLPAPKTIESQGSLRWHPRSSVGAQAKALCACSDCGCRASSQAFPRGRFDDST